MSLSDAIFAVSMLKGTFTSGNGLPHITLNATEIVLGEAVEIADDDYAVLKALLEDMIAKGDVLPLILTLTLGGKMTMICSAVETMDGSSRTITYVGNMTGGGATFEVAFVAMPPMGEPATITVMIAE